MIHENDIPNEAVKAAYLELLAFGNTKPGIKKAIAAAQNVMFPNLRMVNVDNTPFNDRLNSKIIEHYNIADVK